MTLDELRDICESEKKFYVDQYAMTWSDRRQRWEDYPDDPGITLTDEELGKLKVDRIAPDTSYRIIVYLVR